MIESIGAGATGACIGVVRSRVKEEIFYDNTTFFYSCLLLYKKTKSETKREDGDGMAMERKGVFLGVSMDSLKYDRVCHALLLYALRATAETTLQLFHGWLSLEQPSLLPWIPHVVRL